MPAAHADRDRDRQGDRADHRSEGDRDDVAGQTGLPQRERGYYREYTVPTPGVKGRGARRIVAGRFGEYYYSDDHYRSFKRIRD